jgi:hypothetical protein
VSAPAAPVHRCAFHAGPEEAGHIAVELCRRAVAAGSPVVAHVDDVVRRVLTEGVPRARVVFAPQRRLVQTLPERLADEWVGHLRPGADVRVAVLTQLPVEQRPPVERWREAEHAMSAAVAVRPLEVTCLVDRVAGPPEDVAMARATHPLLWWRGGDLPNPDLETPPRAAGSGVPLAERTLDPHASVGNRAWWAAVLAEAGLSGSRRDELVLVLHEAVGTAAELGGSPDGVRVRVAREGATVTCEVGVRTRCPALHPHTVPEDRRLLLLWLAEKVSPAVTLTVLPTGAGSRIVVRAEHPDGD